MKKKTVRKLVLAKETVAALLPQVAGGITAAYTNLELRTHQKSGLPEW